MSRGYLVLVKDVTYPADQSGNVLRSAGNNIANEGHRVGVDKEPTSSKDVCKPAYSEECDDLSQSHRKDDPDSILTGTWPKLAFQITSNSDTDSFYQFLR